MNDLVEKIVRCIPGRSFHPLFRLYAWFVPCAGILLGLPDDAVASNDFLVALLVPAAAVAFVGAGLAARTMFGAPEVRRPTAGEHVRVVAAGLGAAVLVGAVSAAVTGSLDGAHLGVFALGVVLAPIAIGVGAAMGYLYAFLVIVPVMAVSDAIGALRRGDDAQLVASPVAQLFAAGFLLSLGVTAFTAAMAARWDHRHYGRGGLNALRLLVSLFQSGHDSAWKAAGRLSLYLMLGCIAAMIVTALVAQARRSMREASARAEYRAAVARGEISSAVAPVDAARVHELGRQLSDLLAREKAATSREERKRVHAERIRVEQEYLGIDTVVD